MITLQPQRIALVLALSLFFGCTRAHAQGSSPPFIVLDPALPLTYESNGEPWADTLLLVDADLGIAESGERVTLTVLEPAWARIEPDTIAEPRQGDSVRRIALTYEGRPDTGAYAVRIVARDAVGNVDTATGIIFVARETWAPIEVWVELSRGDGQSEGRRLVLAQTRYASESVDLEGRARLDTVDGEIELPPIADSAALDVRWRFGSSNGARRSVEPENPRAGAGGILWQARAHGFEPAGTGASDSMRISWRLSNVAASPIHLLLLPANSTMTATRVLMKWPRSWVTILPEDRSSYLLFSSQPSGDTVTFVTAEPAFRDGFIVLASLIESADDESSRGGVLVRAVPSPFSDATRLEIASAHPGAAHVEISDAVGRVVWSFDDTEVLSTREIVWDGCDGDGLALPSGVYYVRAEVAGATVTTAVVLSR